MSAHQSVRGVKHLKVLIQTQTYYVQTYLISVVIFSYGGKKAEADSCSVTVRSAVMNLPGQMLLTEPSLHPVMKQECLYSPTPRASCHKPDI